MWKNFPVNLAPVLLAAALTVPARTSSAQVCNLLAVEVVTRFGCRMPANAANHFLHISMPGFSTAAIQDIGTHVYVFTDDAGLFGISRTITGLFGTYELSARMFFLPGEVTPRTANVTLQNE